MSKTLRPELSSPARFRFQGGGLSVTDKGRRTKSGNSCVQFRMTKLPLPTHRELVEPLSKQHYVKLVFIQKFLQMIDKIRSSSKPILRTLLAAVEHDTTSTTSRNLKGIMLLPTKNSISEVEISDIQNLVYYKVDEERQWRVATHRGGPGGVGGRGPGVALHRLEIVDVDLLL